MKEHTNTNIYKHKVGINDSLNLHVVCLPCTFVAKLFQQ